ncbi:MAG: tetratricopeptide repeat protein [Acidobacteria bacterium]|nr:tetratricopeptide repeat protein [Acidobacteriota bacterium]
MFEFIKRSQRKKQSSSSPAAGAPQKTVVATKLAGVQAASAQGTSRQPVWKVGHTMRVQGLGDFLIHDIKGGEGKSGMGVVYIVVDANSTAFAVKTLQRCYLETIALQHQFRRECETWVKLERHPNIVRAYYVSTIDAQPYVFLEFVSGSDLRKKISSGRIPLRNVLRYSIQFCRGMAYAGKKVPGLVHRDIKPENCLLTSDDVLKITDFGLVKVLAGSGPVASASGERYEDDSRTRHFTTMQGEIGVGTMPYMAPEQFTNFTDVTVQADIYSFGIMLYELLTGQRPLKAQGLDQWYYHHLKVTPPDPTLANPQVSSDLCQLTMRCLAKNPQDRSDSFLALENELSFILSRQYGEELPSAESEDLEIWELLNKGTALFNLGQTKAALECLDRALAASPRLDGAWLNKGVILASMGRFHAALECYDKAVEINPKSAHAWYNRGIVCQTQDMCEQSLLSYTRALELDPYSDFAWVNKGVMLRKLNRAEEAVACYDRALAINPNSAVVWYNKGFALRQLGRVQEELQCYDRALAIDPQSIDAWLNKGAALRKLNRLIEADVCYDRVLAAEPRHAAAWYNKGIVLRRLGQKQQAQYAFQKAAVLDPKIATDLKRQGLYSG